MGNRLLFTPKGVAQPSPGSRSAPWGAVAPHDIYPVGVAQGGAYLVQPLRGRSAWGRLLSPGCAARPWAELCNAFGVKRGPWLQNPARGFSLQSFPAMQYR